MACEPNDLASLARCFCGISQDRLLEIQTYLLCQIMTGGAISGGGTGLAGAGDPEGVVIASPGTTYLNTTSGSFWVKRTGTGNTGWLALIV